MRRAERDQLTPTSGWDRAAFDRANQGCLSDSGTFSIQSDCTGLLTANDATATCQVTPLLDEQVTGTIGSLAGCNKLFSTAIDEPSVRGILERSPEGVANLLADAFEDLRVGVRHASRDFH